MAVYADPVAQRLHEAAARVLKFDPAEPRDHGKWTRVSGAITGRGKELKMDGNNRADVYSNGNHIGRVSYDPDEGRHFAMSDRDAQRPEHGNTMEEAAEKLHEATPASYRNREQ